MKTQKELFDKFVDAYGSIGLLRYRTDEDISEELFRAGTETSQGLMTTVYLDYKYYYIVLSRSALLPRGILTIQLLIQNFTDK